MFARGALSVSRRDRLHVVYIYLIHLVRYQMKIMSIENLRKDGKFYDDRGHIPEGNKQ
jgi:hypothetical protein